jgi:hypothetical protein
VSPADAGPPYPTQYGDGAGSTDFWGRVRCLAITLSNIVGVGASAVSLTVAKTLRREGYGGRLTLVTVKSGAL